MTQQEKGKWKPYNVKAIVQNVRVVLQSRTIEKLNKPTYQFITLHMHFIAHYSLYGFMDCYKDLRKFALALQTSEYSDDKDSNLNDAQRRYKDGWYTKEHGAEYEKSIADAINGIILVVREHEDEINFEFGETEKQNDIRVIKSLMQKNQIVEIKA